MGTSESFEMHDTQYAGLFAAMRANPTLKDFTDREIKEIIFAMVYARDFVHGTDGHNRLVIIDKLYRPLVSDDTRFVL